MYTLNTINDLIEDPKNPRRIKDSSLRGLQVSEERFGDISGIVWNRRTGELVCGHQRMKALRAAAEARSVELGLEELAPDASVVILPSTPGNQEQRFGIRVVDWDKATQRAANVAANAPGIQGQFTPGINEFLDQIKRDDAGLFDDLKLDEIEVDLDEDGDGNGVDGDGNGTEDGSDNIYTQKVEAPMYEPSDVQPELGELYVGSRTHDLIQEIQQSEAPGDVKEFLVAAAHRHTVFRYDKIADFYAHASPTIQRLMENSALVVIDYEQAIELGYVKLSAAIQEQQAKDHANE